jgi:hypothetical protein
MTTPDPSDWQNVDPAFDGHLHRPTQSLTTEERLDWLWQQMQLRYQVQSLHDTDEPGDEVGGPSPETRDAKHGRS